MCLGFVIDVVEVVKCFVICLLLRCEEEIIFKKLVWCDDSIKIKIYLKMNFILRGYLFKEIWKYVMLVGDNISNFCYFVIEGDIDII